MKIMTVDITPELAATYLQCNVNNRNVRPLWVKALARDMKNGAFKNNGDAIRFDSTGNLIDGQHRLLAVLESGVTLREQIVVYDIAQEAVNTIDSGAKRTDSDRFKMASIPNSAIASATARAICNYEAGDLTLKSKFTSDEVRKAYDAHEKQIVEALPLARSCYKAVGGSGSLYVMVFTFGLSYDTEKTKQFAKDVSTGVGLQEDSPALAFRNAVTKSFSHHKARMHDAYFLQLLIKAFNKAMKNQRSKLIRWAETERKEDLFFHPVLVEKKKEEAE